MPRRARGKRELFIFPAVFSPRPKYGFGDQEKPRNVPRPFRRHHRGGRAREVAVLGVTSVPFVPDAQNTSQSGSFRAVINAAIIFDQYCGQSTEIPRWIALAEINAARKATAERRCGAIRPRATRKRVCGGEEKKWNPVTETAGSNYAWSNTESERTKQNFKTIFITIFSLYAQVFVVKKLQLVKVGWCEKLVVFAERGVVPP